MFQRHVLDQLTALVDEQLTPAAATRVSGHLATCMQCQAALEQAELRVRLLSDPEQPEDGEAFAPAPDGR